MAMALIQFEFEFNDILQYSKELCVYHVVRMRLAEAVSKQEDCSGTVLLAKWNLSTLKLAPIIIF